MLGFYIENKSSFDAYLEDLDVAYVDMMVEEGEHPVIIMPDMLAKRLSVPPDTRNPYSLDTRPVEIMLKGSDISDIKIFLKLTTSNRYLPFLKYFHYYLCYFSDENGKWLRVRYMDEAGWLSGDYVLVQSPEPPDAARHLQAENSYEPISGVTVSEGSRLGLSTNHLNLRAGPGESERTWPPGRQGRNWLPTGRFPRNL